MVTKQYKELRLTFHYTNQTISALVPTARKTCLVLRAGTIYSKYSTTQRMGKKLHTTELYKVKPTWYLKGSWTALQCTTEAKIISVVVSWIADEMSSYCTNLMN
jgi:hypothetical protein